MTNNGFRYFAMFSTGNGKTNRTQTRATAHFNGVTNFDFHWH